MYQSDQAISPVLIDFALFGYSLQEGSRTRTEHALLHPDLYEKLHHIYFNEADRVSEAQRRSRSCMGGGAIGALWTV